MTPTPAEWPLVEKAYNDLVDLDPEARAEGLAAFGREHPTLVAELQSMLESSPSTSFLAPHSSDNSPVQPEVFPQLSNYEILSVIGRGGMGTVYKAQQLQPRRTVALKVVKRGLEAIDEASFTAGLEHEGIVKVYEAGSENGFHFYSMELVKGFDLSKCLLMVLAAAGKDPGAKTGCPLPAFRSKGSPRAIAEIGAKIADAIETAHKSGVLHRDIKPSNIILTPSGNVKIVDFGIAAPAQQADIRMVDLFGDPPYMSPERLQCQPLDQRTDVYSIGVVLYELLTLRKPFSGEKRDVIGQIKRGNSAATVRSLNRSVPIDLQTIVERATAGNRDDRYDSAGDLRDDLFRFLAHEAIVGTPQTWAHRAKKWAYRKRRWIAGTAGVAAIAAAASMWAVDQYRQREVEKVRADARKVLAAGSIESLSLNNILSASNLVYGYDPRQMGEPPQELVELSDQLEQYRRQKVQQAARDVEEWRRPEVLDKDREFGRLTLLRRLIDLHAIFPMDAEVRRLAAPESIYPRLSVRTTDAQGRVAAASVRLREINPVTMRPEPARFLGPAPIEKMLIAPGYYRVEIEFADGGMREVPSYFGLNSVEISMFIARRGDEDAVTRNMVSLPGGDVPMPDDYERFPFGSQSVRVDPFLIDACEVSNREYKEFLVATGRKPPAYWPEPYEPSVDDLPVVGVSWADAAAYATWAGKRLPTLPEWLFAAGFGSARTWPWSSGADANTAAKGNIAGTLQTGASTPEAERKCYLANAAPVKSHPDARTPEGVFHLFGNVSEWTESMAVNFIQMDTAWTTATGRSIDALAVSPWERIMAGAAWNATVDRRPVSYIREFGISASHHTYHLGFRCAKSLTR